MRNNQAWYYRDQNRILLHLGPEPTTLIKMAQNSFLVFNLPETILSYANFKFYLKEILGAKLSDMYCNL